MYRITNVWDNKLIIYCFVSNNNNTLYAVFPASVTMCCWKRVKQKYTTYECLAASAKYLIPSAKWLIN